MSKARSSTCSSPVGVTPPARTFFTAALAAHGEPDEIITDLAQALETVIEEVVPDAFHNTDQYANNCVECDHG
jgi:transposase-like protein